MGVWDRGHPGSVGSSTDLSQEMSQLQLTNDHPILMPIIQPTTTNEQQQQNQQSQQSPQQIQIQQQSHQQQLQQQPSPPQQFEPLQNNFSHPDGKSIFQWKSLFALHMALYMY